MNVAERILEACRQFPERPALRDDAGSRTYRELDRDSLRLGHRLRAWGLAPGERVALFLPNSADYLVVLLAVLRTGGVAVPLNYRFADRELPWVLGDSGARILVVEARDEERARALVAGTAVAHLVVRGERVTTRESGAELLVHALSDAWRDQPAEDERAVPRRGDDTALIMYTSGTSGRPKGVRQTHRNNSAAIDMVAASWRLSAHDRLLQALPLFHVGGLQCTSFPALAVGAATHLLPRWNAGLWLDALEEGRPTFSALVTTMLVDVLGLMERERRLQGPAALRFLVFGGSATPVEVPDRLEQLLGVPLIELYGQTETTGLITTYGDDERRVPGSMGRVRADVAEAVLLDGDGRLTPVAEGRQGELAFRGDIVTPGYWGAPEDAGSRWVDGFLRTGDAVRVEAEGYLHYVDRIDNMIVTGGENVYPAEVEAVLVRHPDIVEAAVIGTAHPRLVQQVTALIVTRRPSFTPDDLRSFLKADRSLAEYKWPRRVELVDELPRTGSGKIDRARLTAQFAAPHDPPN